MRISRIRNGYDVGRICAVGFLTEAQRHGDEGSSIGKAL